MIPNKQYSIDTLLEVARRRKWLIILPALLVVAGAAVVIYRLPNVYRSESLILVVPQRVPESYVRSTVTARIEDRLQAISQQILSRTRLEQIVQDFSLSQQAIEVAAESELVLRILGEHTFNRFIEIKRAEWDDYRVRVTPWEIAQFLPVL